MLEIFKIVHHLESTLVIYINKYSMKIKVTTITTTPRQ